MAKKKAQVPVLWMRYDLIHGKKREEKTLEFIIANGLMPTHANQIAGLFETIRIQMHADLKNCKVIPVSWTFLRYDEVK